MKKLTGTWRDRYAILQIITIKKDPKGEERRVRATLKKLSKKDSDTYNDMQQNLKNLLDQNVRLRKIFEEVSNLAKANKQLSIRPIGALKSMRRHLSVGWIQATDSPNFCVITCFEVSEFWMPNFWILHFWIVNSHCHRNLANTKRCFVRRKTWTFPVRKRRVAPLTVLLHTIARPRADYTMSTVHQTICINQPVRQTFMESTFFFQDESAEMSDTAWKSNSDLVIMIFRRSSFLHQM